MKDNKKVVIDKDVLKKSIKDKTKAFKFNKIVKK